jgi:hypothetical protein
MDRKGGASGQPHLFTLRLWREALGRGRFEWRCRVEFVHTGEVRYFREDAALVSWLLEQFAGIETLESGGG